MGDYEKLSVWKKSHVLTCDVYRITATQRMRSRTDEVRRMLSGLLASVRQRGRAEQ